ncbi:uncharacterized protein METZ01_LOCUS109446 [marine metagenome]|uniref:Uncharacterized protein n=1 Tax=marine metagenome TaxID=408172 RepID=A0A381WW87_9ZZZZ
MSGFRLVADGSYLAEVGGEACSLMSLLV